MISDPVMKIKFEILIIVKKGVGFKNNWQRLVFLFFLISLEYTYYIYMDGVLEKKSVVA